MFIGVDIMAIPGFQTLMLPVLELGATGVIKRKEAIDRMANQFKLSAAERAEMTASGADTFIGNRTTWAVTYLVKAGLLERPKKGCFTITEEGKIVLEQKPKHISNKFLRQFSGFKRFQKREKSNITTQAAQDKTTENIETPEDLIDATHKELIANLKSDVLQRVLEQGPDFFENMVIELLIAMGYTGGQHLGKSGDGGIDGVIYEDGLGLNPIYIQAKLYNEGNNISPNAVRDFAGALDAENAVKGIFVTTSSFSRSVSDYVKKSPKRLLMIDGEKLASLMVENNVGVRSERTVELKRIDEDFF